MSSSFQAPQLNQEAANYVPRLPPEVWTEVFRRLDIESLFNVAEAAPECECFAFSPTVVKRVTFDQETDERIITKFVRTTREELGQHSRTENVPISSHARELHFTDCIALTSETILGCAQNCCNLREMYCVNCVVEPAELFVLLSRTLKCVRKLEWTMYSVTTTTPG
ncbi:hypothetical protein HPB50_005707 [Hyalomma asiaticum]|uniref:Uncharacterized protein n=1 Tax=Hyalomma asiaticum TaxID=266040 RepID=A0ACB7RVP5_HYAAI|nr:hypothetical protein HPB50_005707 [Hyalomma asiaticum]